MTIKVALGALADEPPSWLITKIRADDQRAIESAVNPRRRRELLWSRGLRAVLALRMADSDHVISSAISSAVSPPRFSIAHDRRFVAVAMSPCGDIGIDLQSGRALESCHKIARAWFPDVESQEICAADCDRFLLSWVIKEAWAKCMRRSLFETCRAVGVWRGQVHVASGATEDSQFAWSRQDDGIAGTGVSGAGFAMGICLNGKSPRRPVIECLMPASDSELRRLEIAWQWLPAAAPARQ